MRDENDYMLCKSQISHRGFVSTGIYTWVLGKI